MGVDTLYPPSNNSPASVSQRRHWRRAVCFFVRVCHHSPLYRCEEQQPAGHLVAVTCMSHLYLRLLIAVFAPPVFAVNTRGFNSGQLSEAGKHSAGRRLCRCLAPMTAPVRGLLWATWYTGTLIYLHNEVSWGKVTLPTALCLSHTRACFICVVNTLFPINLYFLTFKAKHVLHLCTSKIVFRARI